MYIYYSYVQYALLVDTHKRSRKRKTESGENRVPRG